MDVLPYTTYPEPVNNRTILRVDIPTPTITWRAIAHSHASVVERAFYAADWVSGRVDLTKPTRTQGAMLWRISTVSLAWALRRQEQRELILAGELPLVPPSVPKASVVSASNQMTDADLADLAKGVGFDAWVRAAIRAGY